MSTSNPVWPVPEPDAAGPIRGADTARDAVRDTIDLWSPYYLGVLSKRLAATGRIQKPLQHFGHWRNTPSYRSIGTGQPAAFMVTVAATMKDPDVQANGLVIATWRTQVRVLVYGTTWQQASDRTAWYEQAVLLSVLQHRGLGGVAKATKWAGSAYAVAEHTSTRTVQQVTIGLDVTLDNVLSVRAGPATPPTSGTPGQDPTADDVVVNLTKVPITEPL